MEFAVLGPLRVRSGDQSVDIGGPRQRRLLAALLAHPDEVVSTDRLIEIVFEQDPPEGAAKTIRTYIARLRRSLAGAGQVNAETITTRPPGYGFSSNGNRIDTIIFARKAEVGGRLMSTDPVSAVAALEEALDLWRGPPFEEFLYEDWARPEIDRLSELHASVRENLVEARLACGLHEEVIPELRLQVAESPLREKPWRLLMLALYRSGRQAEALRAAEQFRVELGEVGLEPSGDLVALERSVAAHDPALHLTQPAGSPLRGYRLGKLIGEGAHGVVYHGIQPGIGREVAVKAIKADLVDRPDFIRRFDVEAQLVANLEHPHIVPVYDYWREPGGAYLVMRRLDSNLSDELTGGPLDIARSAEMAEQLGSALVAAHEAGVVHGDLKPSNILLDSTGNAYLSDFGVATLLDQPDDHLSPSSGYESPEVSDGGRPGPESDQFGLAVLLAQTLTGTMPFGTRGIAGPHERIRSIHAARPAVPAQVDEVLERAAAWSPAERYPDMAAFIEGLVGALEGRSETFSMRTTAVNPYKGLRPFEEADAMFFFGRERQVSEVIDRMRRPEGGVHFVTLVGASGSGKSSIVRAGVLPEVRSGALPGSDEWLIATMTPGIDPFSSLAAGLLPVASRVPVIPGGGDPEGWIGAILDSAVDPDQVLLLVIDQMEELFTLAEPMARDRFVSGLTRALVERADRLRVVATLRADFYDRPLQDAGLAERVKRGGVTVVGMSNAELTQAIVEPAVRARVEVEPALATQLVAEVVRQPASLPLLQFTLRELYENRNGRVLDLASYQEIGGIETAVARHAESIYSSLPEAEWNKVRHVFLKLITVSEQGAPTRRRLLVGDLGVGNAGIVEAFANSRLLTLDADPATRAPTAEISHEALITHWPRLRRWVAEAEEDLIVRAKLSEASSEWHSRGRDDSDLYRGARLEAALDWAARHPDEPGDLDAAFLTAGVDLRDAEEQARRAQLTKQRRDNLRLRRMLVGLGATLVIALLAGFMAVTQRNQARNDQVRTSIQSLVSASSAAVAVDPQLGLLLATEALSLAIESGVDAPSAEQAIHDSLAANREILNVPNHENGIAHFSPDGERFIGLTHPDSNSVLQVWSVETLQPELDLRGHGRPIFDAVFSPDGSLIATTSEDGTVRVWDSTSGAEVHVLEATGVSPVIPAFSNDGTMLAVNTFEGEAWVWETNDGSLLHRLQWPDLGDEGPGFGGLNLAFSPDDTLLALIHQWESTPDVLLWDVTTGRQHGSFDDPSTVALDVAFTPDGSRLITGGERGILLWDVATGEQTGSLLDPEVSAVRDIEMADDGRVAAGGVGDTLVWDLETEEVVYRVQAHTGEVDGIDLNTDGELLLTGSAFDGTTRLWDLSPTPNSWLGTLARPMVPLFGSSAVFSPDGARVAGTRSETEVAIWDAQTGGELEVFDTGVTSAVILDYSQDGARLAVGGWEGAMIRNLTAGTSDVLFRDDPAMPTPVGVSLHPNGEVLASGSSRGLEVWRLDREDEPELLYPYPAWGVAYSRDGSMLAVSSDGPESDSSIVVVFDTSTSEPLASIPIGFNQGSPHLSEVTHMAFTSDGERLVTGAWDGSVAVWDTGTWEVEVEMAGHDDSVVWVAIDPGDARVATASFEGSVNVWDIGTGIEQVHLTIGSPLTGVDFSSDGEVLVIAPDSGPIQLQAIDRGRLFDLAQDRLTRGFTPAECAQYAIVDCSGGEPTGST